MKRLQITGLCAMAIAVMLEVMHSFFGKFTGAVWYFPVTLALIAFFIYVQSRVLMAQRESKVER